MKKSFSAFIFIFSFISILAQKKDFTIEWTDNIELATSSSKKIIPAFSIENLNYSEIEGLRYISEWTVNGPINESSASISNIKYETIAEKDLMDLDLRLIPTSIYFRVYNSYNRGNVTALVSISPIIKDKGVFKKIVAFDISYDFGPDVSRLNAVNANQNIVNSSLSDGSFYRFSIDKTGIYKLSRRFLSDLGVDVNSINPKNIGVYGNGGQMLPYKNNVNVPFDLTENAIKFIGEEDNSLDEGDYILFYAIGNEGYNEDSNTNLNIYSDNTYYYIKVGSNQGKRIAERSQPSSSPDISIDTFTDYQFHEVDQFNLVKVGRRWFGDRFDVDNVQQFSFNFPNIVSSEPAIIKVYAAAVSDTPTNMEVQLNGSTVSTMRFLSANDPVLASGGSFIGQQSLTSDEVNFTLTYNNNGNPSSLAYLDYISVEAKRGLTFINDQLLFYNKDVISNPGIAEYTISNGSDIVEIWNVTDQYNVSAIDFEPGENLSFKDIAGSKQLYIASTTDGFLDPSSEGAISIANQDLKGTIFFDDQGNFQDIDYIIITPSFLRSQAERLADINRKEYGLTVRTVSLEDIYLEFSSGQQDIAAIRNFLRYVYKNASSPEKRLKYACMFGDASFDYKNRISNNTNIAPSWHAYNSFSLTGSFVSDDFFGMMDDNEGDMATSDKLDIAMGRILAEDIERARDMVNKIEQYYAEEAYGSWRNNYIVVSDDVDFSYEEVLQKTTDDIGNEVTQNKPYINVVKIHSDAFEQSSSASGDRYPSVTKEMKDAIEVGAVALNYFGHGGEDGLALERIFDKTDAQELNNICKYNCFVTVTCEYTRFDNPDRPTAGEFTYWNKQGGAIGLITTTRQIFVTVGVSFNIVLEKYLFSYDTDEELSIGEALRRAKNDASIAGLSQKRLVFCIGDPAMKLVIPDPQIRLTAVNGNDVNAQGSVLKALDKVNLSGEIVDASGAVIKDFNGVLTATIFDKDIERTTLANDGTTDNNGDLITLDFKTLGEIIFKGQATVTNGVFDFDFVVPRDIGVPIGRGKASFYAKRLNELKDRTGFNSEIRIGGINENAEEDNTGPIVQLFMNDENFVSGGITNESPTLIAKLSDEHGINTASGIGHDIIAILDGDETNPFVLNDYYTADVDDFTNGSLSYAFRDLEPGLHTLTLKAWDVYNNSSITEIQFVVYDEDEELVIENVLNYPNPFIDYTEFWFNHNSSGVLDVSIQIFTVSGKLVRTLNGQTGGNGKTTSSLSRDIVWDGRDDFGDKIGKGVYVYKLKVRSNELNKQVEKIEKLVIL